MQLSVTQYASKVNKTRQAILWQIKNNKLPDGVKAEKVGNSWVISGCSHEWITKFGQDYCQECGIDY